ncbi:MAG: amino acid-binding protein [Clostridiales bacterium]|nr:amino acid-binding protein [Clostridiales bacterium]
MFIKQLCVFIENKHGKFQEVTKVFTEYGINMISLSLSDSTDYGVARLIVSDTDKAQKALAANGFASVVNEIMAVKLDNKLGELNNLVKQLNDADIDVQYVYALTSGKQASILIKTLDDKKAEKIIAKNYSFYSEDEIKTL